MFQIRLLLLLTFCITQLPYFVTLHEEEPNFDYNGYVMYCPCMGRFGNQADQFIGALAFAKGLNRTLVLPPWVTYPSDAPYKSLQIPFDRWFKVKPIEEYTKVLTMEYFMENLATKIWPIEQRIGFCYSFREGRRCAMKDGNPFGPFWNHFNISFTSYDQHVGLLWDTISQENTKDGWVTRFPSQSFPVLAFQGAPGHFPSLQSHQYLQKFIHFSSYLENLAQDYIKNTMNNKRYVAIHLRNGIDFTRVCDDISKYTTLFASVQCTGYNNEHPLSHDMCNPSTKEILTQVKKYIKHTKAEALYIATDNNPMVETFKRELKKLKISVFDRQHTNEIDDPLIDVALLSNADYFIGNCVSTFSAFVRRHRESNSSPVAFFGIDYTVKRKHEEL